MDSHSGGVPPDQPPDDPTPDFSDEDLASLFPAGPAIPPAPGAARPPLAPLPPLRRTSARPWLWLGVYATIVIAVIGIGVAAIVAYNHLVSGDVPLTARYTSRALGIQFEAPAGWTVVSGGVPLLAARQPLMIVLADRRVPAGGPYDRASLVIALQRIDPVTVFGVPPACQGEIAHSVEATFACVRAQGHAAPGYELFNSDHYRGAKLPGTLPPGRASLPIILFATGQPDWLALIIAHWDGYPDAPRLFDRIARTLRPLPTTR